MKRIVGLLALLALLPSANAGELTNSAEYRLRYQLDQDKDGNSKANPSSQNTWMQRFKLSSTFRSGEKLTGQLTLLHNATWGHGFSTTGDTGTGLMDGTGDAENMVLVNEAYGAWMASSELMFRFGRGALNMGDSRVIGVNDWEATPYAFEGALITWDKEFARFNAYGVKFAELGTSAATLTGRSDPEIVSYGLSVDWKSLPEFLKMANFHVILVNKDATSANGTADLTNDQEARTRYGLTVGGDAMNIDYRLTAAMHSGKITDIVDGAGTTADRTGSMIDAELGYSMPEVMNSRVSFLYHMDSGDDGSDPKKFKTYDPFFYEKHDNAGWMDIFGWGNLTYMQLKYTMDIMDDLNLAVQYLMFTQSEEKGAINVGANGSAFKTAAGDTTKSALGSEIDLAVTKKYDGGLDITARAGMFSPGDEYKATNTDDAYTQFFVEGKMTF